MAKAPKTPKAPKAPKARVTRGAWAPRGAHPRLHEAMAWLEGHATAHTRQGLARYGIVTADPVLGVSMADTQRLGKVLGRDHALAGALWRTGVYDARMLTAFVDEPVQVTPSQMDRWCREFDNWAYCDTLSFHLFDRTPHAWAKVEAWSGGRGEFVKRTAFALLWSLALHDKTSGDEPFLRALRLVEREAADAPVRDEGREHGPARGGPAWTGGTWGGRARRAAPGGVPGCRPALGRTGRAQDLDEGAVAIALILGLNGCVLR